MKVLIVGGPPAIGKTSIIKQIVAEFAELTPVVLKIDVVKAFEDQELSCPVKIGYSGDLCPDHAGIVVMKDAIEWASQMYSKLLIIESAGLCLRCVPYINQALGIVVLSATNGSNSPLKMVPMITFADVAVVTKIDLISQAEKEVFRECVKQVTSSIDIIETNALQGTGLKYLMNLISEQPDIYNREAITLRGCPPLGVCTICIGKKEIGWQNHFGVLRKLSSNLFYRGD